MGHNSPTWDSLQHVLRERAEAEPCRGLIFYSLGNSSVPKEVSYRALFAIARHKSQVIQKLDAFKVGQPVLLHLEDHWDLILWFWAVLLANGLPVISSPFSNITASRHNHIQRLSRLLRTPICITRISSLHLFDGNYNSIQLHTVEALGDSSAQHGDFVGNSGHSFTNAENVESDRSSRAFLMLTSGSTGNAKAVSFTHKQVLAAVYGKSIIRSLPPDKAFLNWVGLDHVASLVEIHIQALFLGMDQVHIPAAEVVASPLLFIRLLSRHQVSRSFAPNFFLARLVSVVDSESSGFKENEDVDLSSLTVLASGGEANHVKTCIAASALFSRYGAAKNVIMPGFGMTETCAGAIFNLDCPADDIKLGRSVAALGQCIEGLDMRVTVSSNSNSDINLALPNEPGHLEVRGPVVFDGYYGDVKATAAAFTVDGWFRTGDQAIIDSEGCLGLVGRFKDVMNINGVKINSSDIQADLEQVLNPSMGVVRVIAFPSTADQTEQITVAYIHNGGSQHLREKAVAEIDEIARNICLMSTGCRPLVFSLQQESIRLLPMSSLGKIPREKMRSLFEAGIFAKDVELHQNAVGEAKRNQQLPCGLGTASAATEAEGHLLHDIFQARAPASPITVDLDTSIFDLGYTSIDLIYLKHRIENRIQHTVPITVLMQHPTARSLALALQHMGVVQKAYDPVVMLCPNGTKSPLWLVHPGVGEVLVFMGLARHLADDRPVYGLRARGFDPGQEKFSSIDECVEIYVSAIRKKQPRGPYALAGYSYGTMLAFEVAKRINALADNVTEVRFLGGFNLPPHIKMRMRYLNWNLCLLHLASFLDLVTEARANSIEDSVEFRMASCHEAHAAVLEGADGARMAQLGLGEQELARWADVAYSLQSMAVDYEPSGLVEVMDIFHAAPLKAAATSREEWVNTHLSKWRDFCRTQPRFHEVGGAHYTMIGVDHVSGFAAKLRSALRARGV